MASRMDRYNKSELVSSGRSIKNRDLYDRIDSVDDYTNIEAVATIENNNEIDISKVKEMLNNRENYKKQKYLRSITKQEPEENETFVRSKVEPKEYDIRNMLSKISEESTNNKNRSLNEEQYKFLKSLNTDNKHKYEDNDTDELNELIKTMTSFKKENLSDEDDVGLLNELKSDTMVGDATSIGKIIEQEKQSIKKGEYNDQNTSEIDKSFYTSSFGFTSDDFEDLKDIKTNIKRNNKFLLILLLAIVAIIIFFAIFFFVIK